MAPTVAAASQVSVRLRVVGPPTTDQLHDLTPTVPARETRTFTSPSGRQWTAEVYELPRSVGVRTRQAIIPAKEVLRFSSADLTLDLQSFPADWNARTDDDLIDLVRQSSPPAFVPLNDGTVTEWSVRHAS
ncbi:MAG: hypothetical protein WD825_15325 [Gemmatimonadaceae bacterium]